MSTIVLYKSISSGAQYVTLREYISHPSLVIDSFASPPVSLKRGQQIGGRTTNSKSPGLFVMIGQSETLSSNQIILVTLFSAGASTAALFTSNGNMCNYMEPKPCS
jgi:hypothetical protein